MLPTAQRIFDAARFLVAVGDLGSAGDADRLRWLVAAVPSSAVEAYQHARHRVRAAGDAGDRDVHERVALAIASASAIVGVVVD